MPPGRPAHSSVRLLPSWAAGRINRVKQKMAHGQGGCQGAQQVGQGIGVQKHRGACAIPPPAGALLLEENQLILEPPLQVVLQLAGVIGKGAAQAFPQGYLRLPAQVLSDLAVIGVVVADVYLFALGGIGAHHKGL